LKTELMKMAGELAAKPHAGEWTLATALKEHGSNHLATQEMLELVAALKPVYTRSPEYLDRIKEYDETRLGLLVSGGRVLEADSLRKELAERYPRDLNLQTQYASSLVQRGDFEGAYAWLTKTIGDARAKWLPEEIQRMQWTYLGLLEEQGRFADKLEYLAPILAKNPDDERFYVHQLIALIYVGREAEAEKLIKEWLAAKLDGKDNEPARARAYAAIHIVMNEIAPFGSRHYDVSWHKPLGEFVLRNAVNAHNTLSNTVRSVLQNSQFASSDEMRRVSLALAARLLGEADKLTPRQLEKLVDHVRNSRKLISDDEWKKVAATIQTR